MYRLHIGADSQSLLYHCNYCGNEVEASDVSVMKTYLKSQGEQGVSINKYTKYDPALPRIHNILCPNPSCSPEGREILSIRYNETDMKYMYLCSSCDTQWKA